MVVGVRTLAIFLAESGSQPVQTSFLSATHHLPDKARANHLNPGLMTHAGLIHGRYASQHMGLVATSPTIHK